MNVIQVPVVYNHPPIVMGHRGPRTYADLRQFQNALDAIEVLSHPDAFVKAVLQFVIKDTGPLPNNATTRCLVLLEEICVFASNAPLCNDCNRSYMCELKFETRTEKRQRYFW